MTRTLETVEDKQPNSDPGGFPFGLAHNQSPAPNESN